MIPINIAIGAARREAVSAARRSLPSAKTFLWLTAVASLMALVLVTMKALGWPLTAANLSAAFSTYPFLTIATIIAVLNVVLIITIALVNLQTARLRKANASTDAQPSKENLVAAPAIQKEVLQKLLSKEVNRAFGATKEELTTLVENFLERIHFEQVDLLETRILKLYDKVEQLSYFLEDKVSNISIPPESEFAPSMHYDVEMIKKQLDELTTVMAQMRDETNLRLAKMSNLVESQPQQEHVKMLEARFDDSARLFFEGTELLQKELMEIKKNTVSSAEFHDALSAIQNDLTTLSKQLQRAATETTSKPEVVEEEKKGPQKLEDDLEFEEWDFLSRFARVYGLTEAEIEMMKQLSSKQGSTEKDDNGSPA